MANLRQVGEKALQVAAAVSYLASMFVALSDPLHALFLLAWAFVTMEYVT